MNGFAVRDKHKEDVRSTHKAIHDLTCHRKGHLEICSTSDNVICVRNVLLLGWSFLAEHCSLMGKEHYWNPTVEVVRDFADNSCKAFDLLIPSLSFHRTRLINCKYELSLRKSFCFADYPVRFVGILGLSFDAFNSSVMMANFDFTKLPQSMEQLLLVCCLKVWNSEVPLAIPTTSTQALPIQQFTTEPKLAEGVIGRIFLDRSGQVRDIGVNRRVFKGEA